MSVVARSLARAAVRTAPMARPMRPTMPAVQFLSARTFATMYYTESHEFVKVCREHQHVNDSAIVSNRRAVVSHAAPDHPSPPPRRPPTPPLLRPGRSTVIRPPSASRASRRRRSVTSCTLSFRTSARSTKSRTRSARSSRSRFVVCVAAPTIPCRVASDPRCVAPQLRPPRVF